MGKMITANGEMLRIEGNKIKYSKDNGQSWHPWGTVSSSYGTPLNFKDGGKELLLVTDKKLLLYSPNDGRNWYQKKYLGK